MSNPSLSLGIDFGGTSIKIGVVDGQEIIDFCTPIPAAEYETPIELINAIGACVKALREKHPALHAFLQPFEDPPRPLRQ